MAPSSTTVIDVADTFSPAAIGVGLARLWTARGCQLEPVLDLSGVEYVCPLTSAPLKNPVLLSDGNVYEEAAAVRWLDMHGSIPGTDAKHTSLDHRRVLRLAPLRVIIEEFLSSSNVGYLLSEQLEQAMGEAEMPGTPWHRRVSCLEACIGRSKAETEEIQTKLVEAQDLLANLRKEFAAKQIYGVVRLQAAARFYLVRRRMKQVQECTKDLSVRIRTFGVAMPLQAPKLERVLEPETAVLRIQHWWRRTKKSLAKKAKRRRLRQQKKAGLASAEGQVVASATAEGQSVAAAECQGLSTVKGRFTVTAVETVQQPLIGVIQQFAKVQEKEKRAVLGFFLNQLGYDRKSHQILIFVSSEQRAAGLRSALQISPSVEFPVLLIQDEDEEYARFKTLPNSASIISTSVFDRGVDVSNANMVVNFDMPKDLDEYMRRLSRAGKGATTMSLPSTNNELIVIQKAEQHFGVSFRDIQGLAKFKLCENQQALKKKLAAIGSQRQKV